MSGVEEEPPLNCGMVFPGVYRSGFPGRHNIAFLQRLGLRTLLRLVDCEYHPAVGEWIAESGVRVICCSMAPNQEPFVGPDSGTLSVALAAVQQPDLRPMLVHCLRGQQATGVLVGCLRRQQRWSLTATFDEYRRYAGPAASLLDLQMIELFETGTAPTPSPPLSCMLVPSASLLITDSSAGGANADTDSAVAGGGMDAARASARRGAAGGGGSTIVTMTTRGPTRLF